MVKVDSRESINTLSKRFMKVNKGRNVIAIIAIVMTTVMFTSLFTAAFSVLKSNQQQEIRNTMDASHISLQDITKEQFVQVSKYESIKRSGYTIFMTVADNKELVNSQTEIRYADAVGAESYISKPTAGRMPKKYNEVAMSTITMDILGVSHKVGSKVELEFTSGGKKQKDEFVLSGYWKGDPLFMAQQTWVSKDYCLDHCKAATEASLSTGDYEGGYNLSIWSNNVLTLQKQVDEINSRYGFDKTMAKAEVSPAFDYFAEDAIPFGTIAVLLLIIFVSGYLIIYNVFNISISSDIRAYGLLKNVGTTGRQLKKIVRKQSLYMSAVGIPIGLIIGYLVGRFMTPYLLSDIAASGIGKTQVLIYANPILFIVAAIFSLLTVYIGCTRPCRIVASISPVEAVRMNDSSVKKSQKTSGRVSPIYMAFGNVKRTWKKAIIVVISLALPIIILNGVFTVARGFDFDTYISTFISGDFNVSGCSSNLGSSNLRAVNPDLVKAVNENKNVEKAALVYDYEMTYEVDNKGYENLKKMMDFAENEKTIAGEGLKRERTMAEGRQMPAHLLGINKDAFEKLEFQGKKCSWQEFNTGKYVIIGRQPQGYGNFYSTGDIIRLKTEGGSVKEYEVLAIGSEPFDLDYSFGSGTWFAYTFHLPQSEYLSGGGNKNAMKMSIEVKEDKEAEFNDWLTSYIEKLGKTLYVDSRMEIEEQCQGFVTKYNMVLGLLCGVLFVIGILNFYNTSSVSIMTRKKELSLLEAIGMTKKQLNKMLVTECIINLIAAVVIADTIGFFISRFLIESTVGQMFFFTCKMSILPSILALPLLIGIAVSVPLRNYRQMCRKTVVERIRH